MHRKIKTAIMAAACCSAAALLLPAQNPLLIPPALTGTTFNLDVQMGSEIFYDTTVTPTYGINGDWLAPTLIVNQGDSLDMHVYNGLDVFTTLHWHGMHVSPQNDGGPHQMIMPGDTWNPSFRVLNNAATFWYHPHGAGQTDPQVSMGIAGMLIVKDAAEAALALPRTYGTDDFPLIVQSKAFDELKQIAIATEMDTALFVNGTLHPFLNTPSQVVRFRILNGSSSRAFNFGFSSGLTFWQIGTDGGLMAAPLARTRLLLAPGERAEILCNLTGMEGDTLHLMSYGSELPDGIYGASTVGSGADTIMGYSANFLNGLDFELMEMRVVASTPGAITTLPPALVPYTPLSTSASVRTRNIVLDTLRALPIDPPNLSSGPFGINGAFFDMDSINEVCYLNDTEIWNLVNRTHVAHPFHIHDVQFNVTERSGGAPLPSDSGWKDVVLVMPHDSVKFITRFEDFADPVVPYMYHCHFLHHEDDGMMGSFVVIDTTVIGTEETQQENHAFGIFPNPTDGKVSILTDTPEGPEGVLVNVTDASGRNILADVSGAGAGILCFETSAWPPGIYFVKVSRGAFTQVKKLVVLKP